MNISHSVDIFIIDAYFGCFHLLAIVNSNDHCYKFSCAGFCCGHVVISLRYMARSGDANGRSMFNCLRNS